MESLKAMYRSMSDMSKMLVKILLGIIGSLIVIFILIFVVRMLSGGKKGYDAAENIMRNAAIRYYKKHENKLPKDQEEVNVSVETLVNQKYMKELTKYLKGDNKCNGSVSVLNNDGNYTYLPILNCGKNYKTKLLSDVILENNNIVDSQDGLYLDDNNNYTFRGEYVNNYLVFGNLKYRILRINADGTIRLMLANPIKDYKSSKWDDRYNIDKEANVGINNYAVSRIKDFLTTIYNDNKVFSDEERSLIVKQDLCIGSREKESTDLSGSEECSEILENQNLGLIQLNEYLYPSIDENCTNATDRSCLNYNYMKSYQQSFWTITPYSEDSFQVYRISNAVYLANAKSSANVLFTLHLSSKVQLEDGDGSQKNPYVVKKYSSK